MVRPGFAAAVLLMIQMVAGQAMNTQSSIPGVRGEAARIGRTDDPLGEYAVRITNEQAKPIVYFAVRYVRRTSEGRRVRNVVRRGLFDQGAIPMGGNAVVYPNGSGSVQFTDDPRAGIARATDARLANDFANASELTVTLDAVVFAGGELAGPDESDSFRLLTESARNEQAVLDEIEASASSVEDARARLDELRKAPFPFQTLTAGEAKASAPSESDFLQGVIRADARSRAQATVLTASLQLTNGGLPALQDYLRDRRRKVALRAVHKGQ